MGANQTAIVVQRRLAEEQVHEQRERLRVTLASIGDAVIVTDTEGRVTFLNTVAQELTGWASEDAEGNKLETVFDILNEKTRQPVENPALRALREGVVVGLANHTVLVARDGTERPIDDSAAPMRDERGNPVGAVLVPLVASAVDSDHGSDTAPQADQFLPPSGKRLLVVDDNQDAANSLAMLLKLQGHEVRVAYSGMGAVEITKTYTPDVVFMDIGMPGMDGYEAARRIREQPGLGRVVLAALTGWGQQEDRRRTAEAGFNHHLVKPPEPKVIESLLADLKKQP